MAQIIPAQNQVTQSPFGGLVYSTTTSGVGKLGQLIGTLYGQLTYWNGTKWDLIATSSLGISGGSGTVTQINTTYPVLGGPITTTGTLTFGGLSTSTPWTGSGLAYRVSDNQISTVATSTLTPTSPLTGSFTQVGSGGAIGCQIASGSQAGCLSSTDWTTFNNKISSTSLSAVYPLLYNSSTGVFSTALVTTSSQTWAGTQTFTNSPVFSTLGAGIVNSTAAGTIYNTATSTPTVTSPITYSGTLGQFIGGVSGTFGCATCIVSGNRDWLMTGSPSYLTPTTTVGIGVFASSTIGSGTVTGGLTVSGTATSTNLIVTNAAATSTIAGGLSIDGSGFVYDYSSNHLGLGSATPTETLFLTGTGSKFGFGGATNNNATTSVAYPTIYSTGSGGVAPFNQQGNLIFQARSDQARGLYFVTGTTQADVRMTIDSEGVVGIGTLTPSVVNANTRLTVAHTGPVDIVASTTDNTTLSTAIVEAYAPGARVFLGAHGTNQVTTQYGITVGGWSELGAINSSFNTSNGLLIGTRNTVAPIVFGVNNIEAARLTSTARFGIGSTSPNALLTVHGNATNVANNMFVIASSTAAFATTTLFSIDNAGKIVGLDTANNYTGRITPTRWIPMRTGTTTSWTASTTATAYSPYVVMPFTGTLQQAKCTPMIGASTGSFIGVNTVVNGSNATPSYFIASSTVGTETYTAGNTFSIGQIILLNFGTTTTATATAVSCTLGVTETP